MAEPQWELLHFLHGKDLNTLGADGQEAGKTEVQGKRGDDLGREEGGGWDSEPGEGPPPTFRMGGNPERQVWIQGVGGFFFQGCGEEGL